MLRTDDSFETVCSKFKERFCSRDQQLDARLKLETDRYSYSEVSFLDHFYAAWSTARRLIPMYPAELLLSIIARHYPPNVQIGLRGVLDVQDFERRLRIFDRSRVVCKKAADGSSSTKSHRPGSETHRFERASDKFSAPKPRESSGLGGRRD